MPRVPIREDGGVRQTASKPEYSNFDTRDGTQALQHGISQLDEAVGNVQSLNDERARRAKARADAIAGDSLYSQGQQFVTEQMYGATKPGTGGPDVITIGTGPDNSFVSASERQVAGNGERQPGYLDSRGTAAHEQSADTLERVQKKFDALLKTAGNEQQRAAVSAKFLSLFESTRRQVAEHEGQQFRVADVAATAGLLATTVDSAANLYNRPEDVAPLAQSALESLKRSALPQEYEAKKQDLLSKVSQAMIGGYLQHGDVAGAEARYRRDEELLGRDGERVKAHIDEARKAALQGNANVAGEHAATLAISAGTNQKTGWLDYAKGSAEIEKLPADTAEDVKIKDAARERFEHRAAIAVQQKKVAVETTFDSALQAYRAAGTLAAVSPADRVWLQNKDNDPDAWERLRRIAHADAEHSKNAPETPEQRRQMTAFLVDVADHPEKYATMTTQAFNSAWLPKLSRNDGDRAGVVLAGMHGKKGDAATKPEQLSPMENKMLLQAGRDSGLFDPKQNDVSKWDDDQAALYYRAQQQISEQVGQYRAENGKPPPLDVVQGWVADKMLKGKNPDKFSFLGMGGGTTRLEAEVKGTPFKPEWSDADKAKAAKALQAAGARTDEVTVDAYLRRKHKLPSLPTQAEQKPTEEAPATPDIPAAPVYGQD